MLIRLMLVVPLLASLAAPALAQQPSSAVLVQQLTTALNSRHLDAFAARDPKAADAFVAALLYPEVQLLVVSARYPVPEALVPVLASADYHEVYAALQGSAIPESKLFVHDMGADGLRTKESQLGDVVYEQVVHQTVFSGDPGDGVYKKNFAKAEAEYCRMLQVLIDALQSPAAQPVTSTATR